MYKTGFFSRFTGGIRIRPRRWLHIRLWWIRDLQRLCINSSALCRHFGWVNITQPQSCVRLKYTLGSCPQLQQVQVPTVVKRCGRGVFSNFSRVESVLSVTSHDTPPTLPHYRRNILNYICVMTSLAWQLLPIFSGHEIYSNFTKIGSVATVRLCSTILILNKYPKISCFRILSDV